MGYSFSCQIGCLEKAGFPDDALVFAVQRVLNLVETVGKIHELKEKNVSAFLYVHAISPRLKKGCK